MQTLLRCVLLVLLGCAATEPVQPRPPEASDGGPPVLDAGPAGEWCSVTGRPTDGGQPGDFQCVAPTVCGHTLQFDSTCCPPQSHECIPGTWEFCDVGQGVVDTRAPGDPRVAVCMSPESCGATHSNWRCCESPDRFCR